MKKTDEPFTVVQLVAMDETGDSYYRMRWPARHLAEQATNWTIINLDARSEERFDWAEKADLLVIFQSHDLDLIPILRKRRAMGLKTLAEYNDNFYAPPPATPVAEAWSSPLIWQSYELLMNESDGLLVTGPGLQKLFSEKTSVPIHILENQLPEAPPAFENNFPVGGEIRMGLAGSLGHFSDYMALRPALQELAARQPRIIFHLMGNETLPQILGLPKERVRYTPWGAMEEYFRFWNTLHLGLAPLLDTPYNRCRSDVKAIEIASRGALPILSRALPYEHFLERTGAPAIDSFSEIASLVTTLLKDIPRTQALARRCFDYVAAERIGPRRTERLELYEEHLPLQPLGHTWKHGRGAHEVTGKVFDQSKEMSVLGQVQKLLADRLPEDALSLLDAALTENDSLPGLQLAWLKLTGPALPSEKWEERFERCRARFPSDLRFALLRTKLAEPGERVPRWNEILQRSERLPEAAQEFFAPMIAALLIEQLSGDVRLLDCAKAFSQRYPSHGRLQMTIAQIAEQSGDLQTAAQYCRSLLQARASAAANEKLFQEVDRKYLRTWLESLEKR